LVDSVENMMMHGLANLKIRERQRDREREREGRQDYYKNAHVHIRTYKPNRQDTKNRFNTRPI
jgi:hypothetical protein